MAAAMAYVDLNPVRAGISKTPETSDFTSVKARIESLRKDETSAPSLYPFARNPRNDMPDGLPFRLLDYLELIDWTGRQIRTDKRGHIGSTQQPILERLGLDTHTWLKVCTKIEKGTLIGSATAIQSVLPQLNRQRRTGLQIP